MTSAVGSPPRSTTRSRPAKLRADAITMVFDGDGDGDGVSVLDDISLEIQAGECYELLYVA